MSISLTQAASFSFEKKAKERIDLDKVATLILSGGEGTRLFPLTKTRCKPAICFGGRYRLIDIPVCNALNSGLKKIFIITQYLSNSLHQHLIKTYRSGKFSSCFVETLSPEAKPHGKFWFEGTADAVRKNLDFLSELTADYFLILSGDQLYQMDLREMISFAQETDADAVVATLGVNETDAKRMGIMQIDASCNIKKFHEKPQLREELDGLKLTPHHLKSLKISNESSQIPEYLGSMGIYLFKRKALFDLLHTDSREDFGKHLIPTMVAKGGIAAFLHHGYWEDIGTVSSFYQANMQLTNPASPFDPHKEHWPIVANEEHLTNTRVWNTAINNSLFCEGSWIEADEITRSVIGPRMNIGSGTLIKDAYLMGNDCGKYKIGENCFIQKAIIDKNVSIGSNVLLVNKNKLSHYDGDGVYIRDGIILVSQGTKLPDGYVL